MVLIAIVLGVALAWLIETGWISLLGKLKTDAKRQQWRTYRNRAGYTLVLLLFFMVAYVLVCGIYGRYTGDLASPPVRILYFVTLPDSLGPIIGFFGGVAIFWLRTKTRWLFSDFPAAIRSPPQTAASVRRRVPAQASGAQDGGAKATYPWLTGIVGIAAVTLVAIITLVIFFPDVLTRVESIKVAGVEARFAASTSHSVRIQAQAERANFTTNYVLNKWRGVESTFTSLVEPVRKKFLETAEGKNEIIKKSEEKKSEQKKTWVLNFLKAFAVPLSGVISCYSSDFVVRNTDLDGRAVAIANNWAQFMIRVLQDEKEENEKQQRDPVRDSKRKQDFEKLISNHNELVVAFDQNLTDRASPCGIGSKERYGQGDNFMRRDNNYFLSKAYLDLLGGLDGNLPTIFSNGYIIAFVADMITFTQTRDQAVEFMNAVNSYLDPNDDAITGKFNFYNNRAKARYQSESWDIHEWISDVMQARSLAERIAETVKGSDKRLERYYRTLTAGTINDLIYGYVRDWLEGHRISLLELKDTEDWAKQLHEWLRAQSYKALLNEYEWQRTHPKSLNDSAEIGPLNRTITMANIYDTLALYELMAGTIKSELPKDRCGRGWALLIKSKDVWDDLRPTVGEDAYRGAIKSFHAHESLYVNACQL